MIDPISPYQRLQEKHLSAPLLAERDLYLSHLEHLGAGHTELRTKAAYLHHIVRILNLDRLRQVTLSEIRHGAEVWASRAEAFPQDSKRQGTARYFTRYATQWLRFLELLAPSPRPAFQDLLTKFADYEIKVRGLSVQTVKGYQSRMAFFFKWLIADRHGDLSAVSLRDVEDFLTNQRIRNCKTPTIVSYCQAFRTFFTYAEARGLCIGGLPSGIKSPRVSKYHSGHFAPTWSEVGRLLKTVRGKDPLQLRARAIILLFVIYGLRNSELGDLRLSDFDWRKETFGIRRAKRGGTQQYPIQFEVGEAILKYLQHARPRTSCRHLFVSMRRPFGPIQSGNMWQIIGQRMKEAGITTEHIGPHALRHACASQLLRKGVAMQDIADFLGHRDTKSVGIYARYDTRLLRKVAAFSLRGVL
jgi:site-specific recombinase XerD